MRRSEVSIVIPVFNQFQFTQACLASLQENQGTERFEVIVVDDGSTDDTAEAVPRIPGIVYLRSYANSGFIASCNTGAKTARGKYLVFLNNDTLCKDRLASWLCSILSKRSGEQAFVGSKLLYPDGRLQGGRRHYLARTLQDRITANSMTRKSLEYNYLREVDYCSAAALMIPKALFWSVEGFDSRYAPAYYEDTDLAFRSSAGRYKVLYQPLSEVIHYEGATGGTDLSTGTKQHQDINRSTFAKSWADELVTKPANGDVASFEKGHAWLQKHPDHRSSRSDARPRLGFPLRMFQILKLLHVSVIESLSFPIILLRRSLATAELQKRGIEVLYHPYLKRDARLP